jgi:hypothetical protein
VARASRTAWQGWLDADTPDVSAAPIGQTQECGWRNNPLVVEARAYAALVGAWFEAETATLYEHADTLARRAEDDPAAELGADLELVLAAVEIVRRDAWLIPIKLSRALHTYEDDTPAAIDAIQNDRNGSAKVALLSMDRCEASWRLLEAWLPSGSAALLAEQLAALRVATERMFPHARRFLRAGFDVPVPVPAPDEGDGRTGISGH